MNTKIPLPPPFKPLKRKFSQDLSGLLAVVFIAAFSLSAALYADHLADQQISKLSEEKGSLRQEIGRQGEIIDGQGEALQQQHLMLMNAEKTVQKLLGEIKRLQIGIGDNWL
tara:strand:+ start:42 stop:377 length:336 start_codon:yes stop_codon:yes gene_type:complete